MIFFFLLSQWSKLITPVLNIAHFNFIKTLQKIWLFLILQLEENFQCIKMFPIFLQSLIHPKLSFLKDALLTSSPLPTENLWTPRIFIFVLAVCVLLQKNTSALYMHYNDILNWILLALIWYTWKSFWTLNFYSLKHL